MFLLLLFGRSMEDEWGWGGLLLSFFFCGVFSNIVSLILLPRDTVSLGASGAIFGLSIVSTLAKLDWNGGKLLLDWRKWTEVLVLGEFVFRQLANEVSVVAQGGLGGINHVAHLAGAAAGGVLVLALRLIVFDFNRREQKQMKEDCKKSLGKGSQVEEALRRLKNYDDD